MYLSKLKEILNIPQLSYEFDELDRIEAFYRSNFKNPEKIGITKFEIDSIFEAYFGTAMMWYFGGKWELETSKSAEAYGLSCIIEHTGKGNVWVALPISDWHFFIETNQLDEPIRNIFSRKVNYFNIRKEFILEPVRNLN